MAKKRLKPPKKNDNDDEFPKFLSIKARTFLKAFRETGVISRAAIAAKCSRRSHVVWMVNPEYARAFAEAQEHAADFLETEARRRAADGLKRFKFHMGKPIIDPETREPYYELEYSDTLLIFLLKGARPDKYADRVKNEHSGGVELRTVGEAQLEAGKAAYRAVMAANNGGTK